LSDIVFGLLVEDKQSLSATELAEELESAARGEEWSWVLWELNHAYFGIIKGSLRLKGRTSQIDDITVISLGEAIDESEDSRAKWLIPARASSGSVHELAHRKIKNFVSEVYGESVAADGEVPFVKPVERVLTPISARRKFNGEMPSGAKRSMAGISAGSENPAEKPSVPPAPTSAPNADGVIARKSRRGS